MRKPPLYKSFLNALHGIGYMVLQERNFQIELAALAINIVLIFLLKVNPADTAVILLICSAVLAAELMNTAVEKLCDFIHPEFHVKIGLIKDISAGAVMLLALSALIIGLIIYPKYLCEYFI
jgi:diacylglycerol kinase (ATP)